jgi:hypothetical protein
VKEREGWAGPVKGASSALVKQYCIDTYLGVTLGSFAVVVGASPRWVLNALTRLGIPRRYDEPLARRLSLARLISDTTGSPLRESLAVAMLALDEGNPWGTWRNESADGAVALVLDLPRFFTAYNARLALATNEYGEKTRGRKPNRRRSAVTRAQEYGVDTTLLDSQLRRTLQQRMKEALVNIEALKSMRPAWAR